MHGSTHSDYLPSPSGLCSFLTAISASRHLETPHSISDDRPVRIQTSTGSSTEKAGEGMAGHGRAGQSMAELGPASCLGSCVGRAAQEFHLMCLLHHPSSTQGQDVCATVVSKTSIIVASNSSRLLGLGTSSGYEAPSRLRTDSQPHWLWTLHLGFSAEVILKADRLGMVGNGEPAR